MPTALALCVAACVSLPNPPPIELALTFDDLPGNPAANRDILTVLAKHGLSQTTGFVNGFQLEYAPERLPSLQNWFSRQGRLGNHTYSHPNLDSMDVPSYAAEIERNEAVLRRITGDTLSWRIFRYPYLAEGRTPQIWQQTRDYLAQHSYRVAEVTIDAFDWAYDKAYLRCGILNDTATQRDIVQALWRDAIEQLHWSHAAAQFLMGRPIKHIALFHIRMVTAAALDAILTSYEQVGVHFIDLDEALRDPVYEEDSLSPEGAHGSFLSQIIHRRKVRGYPPRVRHPTDWIEQLCSGVETPGDDEGEATLE